MRRYFHRKMSSTLSTITKMTPVIHMMRWNMPSIRGAYVEACSGRRIQVGHAPAAAGDSAAAKTKSADRTGRAALRAPRVFFTRSKIIGFPSLRVDESLCPAAGPETYPLNAKSTVFASLPVIVTFWVCVPYFSCHASIT